MTRIAVLITLISVTSCAVPIRNIAVKPAPCPEETAEIWIRTTDPPERLVCVENFSLTQPMVLYRCVPVSLVRDLVAGLVQVKATN